MSNQVRIPAEQDQFVLQFFPSSYHPDQECAWTLSSFYPHDPRRVNNGTPGPENDCWSGVATVSDDCACK